MEKIMPQSWKIDKFEDDLPQKIKFFDKNLSFKQEQELPPSSAPNHILAHKEDKVHLQTY